MILIFSIENEYATSQVIKRLKSRGHNVLRINGDDDTFKFYKLTQKGIFFINTKQDTLYNLLDANSCWWRRTGLTKNQFSNVKYDINFKKKGFDLSDLTQGRNSILSWECTSLINFIQYKIYKSCSKHIGSPWSYGVNKLHVLELAKSNGLKTPKYEIISNLNQIEHNGISTDKFVTKAIFEGIYQTIDKHHFYSYTESYHTKDFLEEKNNISIFPSLIMEQIEKTLEIRSFFLDGSFYSMAIFSQTNQQTEVDFRKYDAEKPNKCEPFQLPKEIEAKLIKVYKALKLNTGSADLILNNSGDYVFLEINPVGQYHMTGEPCNYNLDDIIVDYLIS